LKEKDEFKIVLARPGVKVQFGDPFEVDRFEFHLKLGDDGKPSIRFPKEAELPPPFPMCQKWTRFRELE